MTITSEIAKLAQNGVTHVEWNLHVLNDEDIEELAAVLQKYKSITSLDLHRNNISDEGLRYLVVCDHLQSISLDHNSVSNKGIAMLLQMKSLHSVTLRNNNITNSGAKLLLARCGPDFYANIYGNMRVDDAIVAAVEKKCDNYLYDDSAREKYKLGLLTNNPATTWKKSSGENSDPGGLSPLNDHSFQNGHKKRSR